MELFGVFLVYKMNNIRNDEKDITMQKKVFQLLVDNNPGVLSRISGLFSRRGYSIESITAGVTANYKVTCITIVTVGDDVVLE